MITEEDVEVISVDDREGHRVMIMASVTFAVTHFVSFSELIVSPDAEALIRQIGERLKTQVIKKVREAV